MGSAAFLVAVYSRSNVWPILSSAGTLFAAWDLQKAAGTQADARLEPMTPLAQESHSDVQSLDSRGIRPAVALSQLRGARRSSATSLAATTLTVFLTRWRWQARPRSDSS